MEGGAIAWAAAAAALVAYNTWLNLRPPPAWAYVPSNLALAGVLLAVGAAVGIAPDAVVGDPAPRWLVVVAPVWAGAGALGALARLRPAVRRRLADRRAEGMGRAQLLYHVLVRIPLGTAVPEEVAFRGVLLLWGVQLWGVPGAVALASAAFGLWHVGPTIVTLRRNGVDGRSALAVGAAAAVAVTTIGGVAFSLLRLATGGLLVPVALHWSFNAAGLLLAAAAVRRSTGPTYGVNRASPSGRT